MPNRCVIVLATALALLLAGCQASKDNPERDRLLAKLPQPFTVARTPNNPVATLSSANTAKLLAALKDSRPVEWERRSLIEYLIDPNQPVQVAIMEGTVFRINQPGGSNPATYYQSDQNLTQLIADSIKTDAPLAPNP